MNYHRSCNPQVNAHRIEMLLFHTTIKVPQIFNVNVVNFQHVATCNDHINVLTAQFKKEIRR